MIKLSLWDLKVWIFGLSPRLKSLEGAHFGSMSSPFWEALSLKFSLNPNT